jgi:methenyltetrahydromethanopterin cyclohydrolase
MKSDTPWPSVNRLAAPLVARLIADAQSLGIGVERQDDGTTLVDGGIDCAGSLEAGLRVAEISMGGLGRVRLEAGGGFASWPWRVSVRAANPVLACLGSQYAGWSLSHGEGKGAYTALGSGPGRALAVKEPLFQELAYTDQADEASLVLEVDRRPPAELVRKIQRDCGVGPEGLTLILTPTTSLAGNLQVVARVLEVALHKVHELGFPLERMVDGLGSAPLPPPAPALVEAMGRPNDAIIYGGTVQLFVSGPEDDARELARQLPSRTSRDYGKPFAEIFQAVKGDFYAIDPLLFSPARVIVSSLDSGRSFHYGAVDEATIDRSFGAGLD